MTHLDYTNEEGEFLMTATELRTEWELDALSAQERADEAWLDSWDDEDGVQWDDDEDAEDDWHVDEDSHLDGMWEE